MLFIASSSVHRHRLLKEARIPFQVLKTTHTTEFFDSSKSFLDAVIDIARDKMKSVILPELPPLELPEGSPIYVVTADSLVFDSLGEPIGKPLSIDRAQEILVQRGDTPVDVITAVCIAQYRWQAGKWHKDSERCCSSTSQVEFYIKPEQINAYLKNDPEIIHSSGGGNIEGYGYRFFKSIKGSYTGVIGLPIYELLELLREMGWAENK